MKAAMFLEAEGYTVVSVAGGTDEWAASGRDLSFDPSI
jgi:rhodanese-related sulfurtransferase